MRVCMLSIRIPYSAVWRPPSVVDNAELSRRKEFSRNAKQKLRIVQTFLKGDARAVAPPLAGGRDLRMVSGGTLVLVNMLWLFTSLVTRHSRGHGFHVFCSYFLGDEEVRV